MKLVVHVDGGSRGNPGPGAAAAVLSTPDGDVVDETSVILGHTTNNVAEYRALLLGIDRARERGATEVELINDSELVAKQVDGEYRVKNAELAVLHEQVLRELSTFDRWTLRSVPRAQNAAADAAVNRALDAAGDAPTDYSTYLRIDDLLRLQQPLTPDAHDELLFIVVHQSYELWFKLILHELRKARSELEARSPQGAVRPLKRTVAIERLLIDHLDVLETMGPEGFLEFRDPLAPASGFQSKQFREIEALSPTLYDAFAAQLPGELADLYRDHLGDPVRALLYEVAELLVDHDEQIALWRHHHTLMASREIGSRHGTGGSRGVEYLRSTQDKRFYPALWDVRAEL
jgi:tryptophan 2,3-dioxygenase/ribonuclease HI